MNCQPSSVEPIGAQLLGGVFIILVVALIMIIGLMIWNQGNIESDDEELK